MSLPFTRATTSADALEGEPQEAVSSSPAKRAGRVKYFIRKAPSFREITLILTQRTGWDQVLCAILSVYSIREIAFMARCEICNKGPIYGNRVSHAHNLTRRRWNPNLQRVRVVVGKTHKSMRVCTNCIRSGRVAKA